MSTLLKLMENSEDFFSLEAADPKDISKAEHELQLVFADDYKEYVKTFGAATFDGRELTGICRSERLSVVSTTEHARINFPNFPSFMYVIEELFFDHVLTVQDYTGAIYSYGPADESTFIAKSLQEYLFPDSCTDETASIEETTEGSNTSATKKTDELH